MKKLLLSICVIALLAMVLSAFGGKNAPSPDAPRFSTVSEAAFSMRSSGAEDATSRLVGCYVDENGEKLNFNGFGACKRVLQNLSSVEGTYTLLQSADGASILDLSLGGTSKLYSVQLCSAEGAISLTDADGGKTTLTPVP